ncbi:MAG: GGDEF domain-containing protein [Ignavibacteriales bacterium]
MWLSYEGGRLIVLAVALLWMLWFTREHCPGMRRLALVFCAGVILEALAILARLRHGLRMAVAPFGEALGQGVFSNLGMAIALGSLFVMILETARCSQRHKREAEVDHLTGLFNRRVFFARAERALRDARVGICRPSVAVLDVDNMKEINDLYGHQYGDGVLRHAARAIARSIRHDDVPARHGGDEFAVLFLQTGPDVDTLKTRLEESLQESVQGVHASGEEVTISLSIGVARYPQDGQDIDSLLYAADTRMYSDKATKRRHDCPGGEYEIRSRT